MPLTFTSDLNDNAFQRGLKRMETGAATASKNISGKFASIGDELKGMATGMLTVGAAIGAVKSVLDFGGDIADNSAAIGLTAEQFQGLSGAMLQAGVDGEKFSRGFNAMIQKAEDARAGNEAAAKSFATLGISIEDIKRLSTQELFLAISDALAKAGDNAEVTGAALEILGARNLKMVGAMKAGGDEIARQAAAVAKLTDKQVAAIDALGDAMTRYKIKAQVVAGAVIAEWEKMANSKAGKVLGFLAGSSLVPAYIDKVAKRLEGGAKGADSAATKRALPSGPEPEMTKQQRDMTEQYRLREQLEKDLTELGLAELEKRDAAEKKALDGIRDREEKRAADEEKEDEDHLKKLDKEERTKKKMIDDARRALADARADAASDHQNRVFDVGMMGAGGRREAMRAMRREDRERARAARVGANDARAFSKDLIARGDKDSQAAEAVKQATRVLDDILIAINALDLDEN